MYLCSDKTIFIMEFEGVVLQVLPVFKTQTQRGEFVKQEVVFEQPGEFTRKVCVAFTGERIQSAAELKPGEKVKVSFNIESREWNGRWFTEARGWKIEKLQGAQPQYVAPQQPAAGYPVYSTPVPEAPRSEGAAPNEVDDVPF